MMRDSHENQAMRCHERQPRKSVIGIRHEKPPQESAIEISHWNQHRLLGPALLLTAFSPKFKISPDSLLQESDVVSFLTAAPSRPNSEKFNPRGKSWELFCVWTVSGFGFSFPNTICLVIEEGKEFAWTFVLTESLTSTPGSVSQSADGSVSGAAAQEPEAEREPKSGLLKLNKTRTLFIKSVL
nr:hypothetical protein Iba_chr15eCG1230 [Ipomoea batatas]